jgi:hypothetical protein
VISRSKFETLSQPEQLAHLKDVSPRNFRIVHDVYNGFYGVSKVAHRKGTVIFEEPALTISVSDKYLADFCCLCGLDATTPSEIATVRHIFQDRDGLQHTFCVCNPCNKKEGASDVVSLAKKMGSITLGSIARLIWIIQALEVLRRWKRKTMQFARAALLLHR